MNNMRNKILMTLALLLTAVTGIIRELYGLDGGHGIENATPTVTGTTAIIPGLDGPNNYAKITIIAPFTGKATVSGTYSGWSNSGSSISNYSIEISFADPNAIDVKWDPATKTGTFEMPAYDVEIAPIYAPVAQWAKVDNVDQLPTAIEGVIADTDAPLIVEGTVAFAGTSTEVKQGTVMYAVTPATVTEAPALDAANKWSADVPTAKLVPDAGDVKVWYYIKGADTPEGQDATAENTFNDSEICAEPITVTVLSNKFDIQFKAANDNTIEAGKATVKVGDEAAEVKEGKLTGVKMNSKVTRGQEEGSAVDRNRRT